MLCMSVAVLSTAAVRADDIKLDDGKTVYHNAVITSYDAASVTIRHSTGLARIPIPELPPELRATFQYDPEKAKKLLATEQGTILTTNAVVEADTSRDVARAAWNKSKIRLSGTIVQITSEGVLMREFGKDQVIFIKHAAIGNHADGDFVSIDAAPVGTHKYVTTAGAEATVRAYDAGP